MIAAFSGEYRFLSNFYYSLMRIDGRYYATVEHAFQASKVGLGTPEAEAIRALTTPGLAKRAGRRVTLRPDWENVKLDVMHNLVLTKFQQNNNIAEKLLATGDQELVEGNWWGDTFWGVHDGVGQNHLGRILMVVRQQIREASSAASQPSSRT